MNLKLVLDLRNATQDHEEALSNPKRAQKSPFRGGPAAATGTKLYDIRKNFEGVLADFEIRPDDVTVCNLVEVYETESCTVPHLYSSESVASNRATGLIGRSRLLRIPPVQATAEFILLGAMTRFKNQDLFVEFIPKMGDYVLCAPALAGQDNDYVHDKAPDGLLTCVQEGKWKA